MKLDAELLRYYKILQYSNFVQEARKMMNLQEDEYILRFEKGKTRTTRTKSGLRKLTSAPDDIWYFYGEVQSYVQKNIIEFYDLHYPTSWVLNCIFYGYQFVPEPFNVHPPRTNVEGNLTVLVEVSQRLSADSKRELLKQVGEAVEEGKNLLPTRKPNLDYSQLREYQNLDGKYAATKAYKKLLTLPKKERKEADKAFLKNAAAAFKKNPLTYTMSEFRVDKKDFLNTFEKGL